MAPGRRTTPQALVQTVGSEVADLIVRAREGKLTIQAGGGRFGRAIADVEDTQLRLPGSAARGEVGQEQS